MGYIQFSNYITEKINMTSTDEFSKQKEIQNIKRYFNNRLIIIDEVHNIRSTTDNSNDKTADLLMRVVKNANNIRLVLLSATPMYNSPKEIIWLTNLMNINDKRSAIEVAEVFDKNGNFKKEGKLILRRKLTGYVSYVRSENPYLFPYRVYPRQFSVEHSLNENVYPKLQMNKKHINNPIKYIQVYTNNIGSYQKHGYDFILKHITQESFENMEDFGYTLLQKPLESLNIVYPSFSLDEYINELSSSLPLKTYDESSIIANITGNTGLYNIMDSEINGVPKNMEYNSKILKKYGRIFHPTLIEQYSGKIASICNAVKLSSGIILIYSQYIDSGILPISLALEEMGLSRYCSNEIQNHNFIKDRIEPIDAITMLSRREYNINNENETDTPPKEFKPAKYVIICGDPNISPSNTEDIKRTNLIENVDGSLVKVILITKSGAEGLDFQNIRQVHVLEPWYNMNRIEQIIGRGVRYKSHCNLSFEQRNVQIFLHTTMLENKNNESADLYIYRVAEQKSLQIGKVTRLLKEISVDCILNIEQTNFSAEKIMKLAENQNVKIQLSNGKKIVFKIGDNPFTDICDYMDNCEYKCYPKKINNTVVDTIDSTYDNNFVKNNLDIIIDKVKFLFKERSFYKREVLINSINITKKFPIEQIFFALTVLIKNKTNVIYDKYGRPGHLINKGNIYSFQPIEITDETTSILEKTVPIDYKPSHYLLELPTNPMQYDDNTSSVKEQITKSSSKLSTTIQELLQKFSNNFETVFREPRVNTYSGETDWYKHANLVIDHLHHPQLFNISMSQLEKYVVFHMIDMLLFEEKFQLIQYIFSDNRTFFDGTANEKKIIDLIEKYFNNRIIKKNQQLGIVINKNNDWKLYLVNSNNNWEEGEPEDYRIFKNELNDVYNIDMTKINNIVGFIHIFKNDEMIFKTKNINQARNNRGASCFQAQKADVIKRLNEINSEHDHLKFSKNVTFERYGLCIILEILLRHKTELNVHNKIWFLTPEQSLVNDIIKYINH